jgi:hypothetical protein
MEEGRNVLSFSSADEKSRREVGSRWLWVGGFTVSKLLHFSFCIQLKREKRR